MTMKKLLLASVAFVALASGAAVAADMPLKAPYLKAPPPAMSWTGCYIGGNIGMDWARTSSTDTVTGNPYGAQDDPGLTGGGQVGCDYQVSSSFVLGVRGNYDETLLTGSNIVTTFPNFTANDNFHWTATATGRVGWLATSAFLVYVQGGGAWTRNNITINQINPPVGFESASDSRAGWTVGLGGEYMVVPSLSFFLEGNYMNFGTRTVGTTNVITGIPGDPLSIRQDLYQVLFGVNFRFGGLGGPVVARY